MQTRTVSLPYSDVDVFVVSTSESLPADRGKLVHDGVLLDV
ncbi:MAG TPA: hypothetical protein QGF35_07555 [Dehalococcoidia bacterium]|jgi:hypothetical protein|nr:hypothetical protein [Dehalococcoidia bacterium]